MPVYVGEEEVIKRNMALAREKNYTVEDIETLPEDVRAELIDGQLFYMAVPTISHQGILTHLLVEISGYIKHKNGDCKVYPAPVALYLTEDNRTYLEPDLMVVCDLSKLDDKGCHGAPDMIAEIVSPSTRSRDYLLKLNKYQKIGVREYWIVDPEKKTVYVYQFAGEGQSGTVEIYDFADSLPVGIFENLTIDFCGFL